MDVSQIYGILTLIILIIIIRYLFFLNKVKKKEKLTPLAGLSFAFILAGIIFSRNRLSGYGLLVVGVILAIIDMMRKSKKK